MNSDSHNAARAPARIVGTDASSLDEAARILLAGGLVAVPTETVYGVAADATNGAAVASIFTAKGRPSFNPLICHVASLAMAESLAHFSPLARRLAERFWPGPLTLVLPRRADCPVHDLATAGLPSIGIRIPQHIATLEIILRVGRPLAAPSAPRQPLMWRPDWALASTSSSTAEPPSRALNRPSSRPVKRAL
jgi:L-threonylcarbamoyladenylate synthase